MWIKFNLGKKCTSPAKEFLSHTVEPLGSEWDEFLS